MKSNLVSDWISVSQEAINKPKSEEKNGIKIHFMISPFDIPVATRASLDNSKGEPGIYILEFKYISTEEKTLHIPKGTRGVSLEVGKNSRKIYRIEMDLAKVVDVLGNDIQVAINFNVDNTIKEMEGDKSSVVSHGNADAIRRIFSPRKGATHLPVTPVLSHST
jgi:hypothetical protein